ncbi:putative EKC/KEOPS complex subunit BUD32 [Seiridium unicorne]|uniref:EKC/KEOPS complex subunit BUD32 n=1 Tax=Seiridium unicorne TaxID=138068 RepID=A0ABR2VHK4_9PEZI
MSSTKTSGTHQPRYRSRYYGTEYENSVEDVEGYKKGGFHPVHLNEVLNDRFEVLHKLGYGGFGTVWLCWDKTRSKWCAVKILAADHSDNGREQKILGYLTSNASAEELQLNRIAVPSERFWLEGPNGRHLCHVLPLFGPSVNDWRLLQDDEDQEAMAKVKDVCYQIAEGMAYLHRFGVCHNDFRPHNILMKLDGIDALGREQLLEGLEKATKLKVETVSGDDPAPHGPEYCVVPLDFSWCETYMTPEIAIIDFGESFLVNEPRSVSGIPIKYAAPEILFSGTYAPGLASDVWALGATLYDICNIADLFGDSALSYGVDASVETMEYLLGPLPEPYRKVWFQNFQDSSDSYAADDRNKLDDTSTPVQWEAAWLEKCKNDTASKTGYSRPFELSLASEVNQSKGLGDQFPPLEELRSSGNYTSENRYILDFASLLEKESITWVRGMPVGPGAFHNAEFKRRIMRSKRSLAGKGNSNSPKITWVCPTKRQHAGRMQQIEDILMNEAILNGMCYVWVALGIHDTTRSLNTVTVNGMEQRERHDDDEHATVRMSRSPDKTQLSGHIYLMEEDRPKDYLGPLYEGYSKIVRLMTDDERTVVGGRGTQLYIWGPYQRVANPNGPPEPIPHPAPPYEKKKGREFRKTRPSGYKIGYEPN